MDMTKQYIAPIDPPNKRRQSFASLPKNPLRGLPNYVTRRPSKYTPDGLNRMVKLAFSTQ